jgi:3-deoxy-manno-octulosonate cytidylyltransferase (CMP-KDO synthetase)
MATLAEPLTDAAQLADPNVVKLVTAADGRALYFSRAPIPFVRDAESTSGAPTALHRKHQGIYAYTPAALARLTALEPSALELAERLEQLRALEHGFSIAVVDSDFRSLGVDTPRDLDLVARALGLAEAT